MSPATTDPHPPDLRDLNEAAEAIAGPLDALAAARRAVSSAGNDDGGDPGAHADADLLVRHLANYLAAVDVAARRGCTNLVDVGAGTGAFSVWAARRLGADLRVVEPDPGARAVSAQAFPAVPLHAATSELGAGTAGAVTSMEVVEHLVHDEQPAFVADLASLVAPGGILALSTPDESGYPGGWSGYPPHIGPLDYDGLRDVVTSATGGWPVRVWRLDGPLFRLGWRARLVEPVLNRVWGAAQRSAPALSRSIAAQTARLAAGLRRGDDGYVLEAARLGPVVAEQRRDGPGTGLLAVAERPR